MKNIRVLVCLFMAMLLCGACLGLEDPTPVVSYPTDDALDLSAGGTANCYIVSQGGKYSIDAVKGNSSEKVGDVASVEVLWESFGTSEVPSVGSLISSVSYSDGKINYTIASPFREGNAVIAAKDASGTILWSWHIWLTDQPKEHVYYNNAGTMMDRNLGATSATPGDVGALGLLYQWGRKDPFLGSSSIMADVLAESTADWPETQRTTLSVGTIDYSISHPMTFIYADETDGDWHYSGRDNSLWGKTKTMYDPCPDGWCVPGCDIWSRAFGESSSFSFPYSDLNYGMDFSQKLGDDSIIWYPASGYIDDKDGGLILAGSAGEYWTIDYYFDDSFKLMIFYRDIVYTSNFSSRANGYSVRCQKM